jgi:hypothetical protein
MQFLGAVSWYLTSPEYLSRGSVEADNVEFFCLDRGHKNSLVGENWGRVPGGQCRLPNNILVRSELCRKPLLIGQA